MPTQSGSSELRRWMCGVGGSLIVRRCDRPQWPCYAMLVASSLRGLLPQTVAWHAKRVAATKPLKSVARKVRLTAVIARSIRAKRPKLISISLIIVLTACGTWLDSGFVLSTPHHVFKLSPLSGGTLSPRSSATGLGTTCKCGS